MHGQKIIHRWYVGAWWHAFRLNRRPDEAKRRVYVCHFGQWYFNGETGPKHYHVGRRPTRIR